MKLNRVEIKEHTGSILATYESKGRVYAVRYAAGSIVTEQEIRKMWREERSAFRPYGTSSMSFC